MDENRRLREDKLKFSSEIQRKDPYYEISSSFWINARSLRAELKKVIGHFEGN